MNAAAIAAVATVERITGSRVVGRSPLSGGCVGEVYRLSLANGDHVVAKVGRPGSGLAIEGYMLDYLRRHGHGLPVPEVLHADDTLLVMSWIEAGESLSPEAEAHAADLLAALHGVTAERYGLERDTLIGGLHQPNPPSPRWVPFFAEHRLLYMAREALDAGMLPARLMSRVERFADRLADLLEEPERPALIHGDMWGGNVLCRSGRIAAFIDPAIYYADAEIELAFSTLFSTFGEPFFRRYAELRPIRPGFHDVRRDVYNLYPLLVHVRLFGGGYVASVERILARFGG
ncbi:MAG: fructosamine kinase family protein [Alphaproteobacteria bacterium]